MMIKRMFSVLMVCALIVSCDQEKLSQLEQENGHLQSEYELLNAEMLQKDSYIESYTSTVNEVFQSLESIREREGFITKHSKDIESAKNVDIKQRMLSNIASIDSSLKASKNKLNVLKKQRYSSSKQAAALQETLESLNIVLEEKENFINELKAELEDLNIRFAAVEEELESAHEILDEKNQTLNTGFYIIGSENELKDKGIIIEEGGFLGFRKSKKLASDFNDDDFFTTDILNTNSITINADSEKVKLISPHASASFQLQNMDKGNSALEIVNPAEFWKMKYLVIMTKS